MDNGLKFIKKIIWGNVLGTLLVFFPHGHLLAFYTVNNQVVQESALSSLPYSEGGEEVEDPGLHSSVSRYVDSVNGNDSWPGSKAQPWKTLNKAVAALKDLPAGAHLLLKRGCTWPETWSTDNIHGTDGNRYVLGAYGSADDEKPRVIGNVQIRNSSYWMVRDIDILGQLLIFRTHHSVVFNNEVHGWQSNGIAVHGGTHHIAVVRNLVYDGKSNDGISFHDSNSLNPPQYVGSHHWAVDNIVIGNAGMEECMDLAGDGWHQGLGDPQDVKFINNRLQCKAVPPSPKGGSCTRPFNMAHTWKYIWIIGNIGANGTKDGLYINDASNTPHVQDYTQIRSNIFFGNYSRAIMTGTKNTKYKHNTILRSGNVNSSLPAVTFDKKTVTTEFTRNLVLINSGDRIVSFASGVNSLNMDYNWYSKSASSWQGQTDLHSMIGEVPGVGMPVNSDYNNNPENWYNTDFLDYFIPDASWEGNNMDTVPGAFLTDGTRQGITIEPFPGYDNDGFGWEGPLIIQELYPLKGLNTSVPNINGTHKGLKMTVFPNPSNRGNNITVKYELKVASDVLINVFDGKGRTIKKLGHKNQIIGHHVLQIEGIDRPGAYIVLLLAGKETGAKQVIVQ